MSLEELGKNYGFYYLDNLLWLAHQYLNMISPNNLN